MRGELCPSYRNTWLGLSPECFYLTIPRPRPGSFQLLYNSSSESLDLAGVSFQPLSANLGLECFSLWDLLVNKFTSSSFWILSLSTQLFWSKLLFKMIDSNWLRLASDWIALLGKTASELYELNCSVLNWLQLHSTELLQPEWTELNSLSLPAL